MSVIGWLLWGFAATVVLTTLMAGSQWLKLTRMSIPYLLGTMVTADRDRARFYGLLLHLMNGWIFAGLYVLTFQLLGWPHAWLVGAVMGLVHAAFVLLVGFPMLPTFHPRMASESQGPMALRRLEPPGFFGRNYGVQTAVSIVIAHVVFGMMLGALFDYSGTPWPL